MNTPEMIKIKQNFKTDPILDIPSVIRSELMGIQLHDLIRPGETVAVTAGSRGIANIVIILKTIVDELTHIGAKPFIVPAMGSHGGGTAEGQLNLIGKYGITPEKMGIPVKSDISVIQIGETRDGLPVYLDRYASQADHIVVVNRIKPHTDFTGDIESGLIKMMAIGLGKQKGAELYHKAILHQGYYNVVLSVGREVLKKCPVAFGLALVENQKDETQIIRAIRAEDIEQTEKELLVKLSIKWARTFQGLAWIRILSHAHVYPLPGSLIHRRSFVSLCAISVPGPEVMPSESATLTSPPEGSWKRSIGRSPI